MSEKLERCPFCGGEADFWTRQAGEVEEYQALIINCKDCSANMEEWVYKYDKNFADNFEKKKAEMFEAWNRRIEWIAKVEDIQVEWGDDEYVNDRMGDMYHYGNCGNCGETVSHNQKYCHECGVRLEWN